MKVLVTGAGALLGQGIIKSLRMAQTRYDIVAVDPDGRSVGLYWADRSYIVPLATDATYLERIVDIVERERPSAVLIGTDVELMTFATNRAYLEDTYNTHIIVSEPEVIRIADDKWLTAEFLASNGFPHPKSVLPEDISHLLEMCDFPFVVKPRSGARSIGLHMVHNKEELNLAINGVNNPVIQECISSPECEYTSGIIMFDKVVMAVVSMRRDLKDGNTYRAYSEPNCSFNSMLSQMAERLGGFGPLNFQFRVDGGVPKVFEINARFSGTTPFRAYAGFNEVDAVVRKCVLGQNVPDPRIVPAVIVRYWDEIVIGAHQISAFNDSRFLESPSYERGHRF